MQSLTQKQAEMQLRYECLKLACALAIAGDRADSVVAKASIFFDYVSEQEESGIEIAKSIPKIITQ